MKVVVFCASRSKIDPELFQITQQLGEWIGKHQHTLVYGGCKIGLMGEIGSSTHKHGGQVWGIVPRLMEEKNIMADYLDVVIPCDNLSDRKDLMLHHADVIITLPGGIGTLDELFTVMAAASLHYHHTPIILYNVKDFWNPLLDILSYLHQAGMTNQAIPKYLTVVNNWSEMEQKLNGL